MKFELNSLELRKVGIYFKDVQEKRFRGLVKKELKEILHTLRESPEYPGGIPDVLGKLNDLTIKLNKYYKDTEIEEKDLKSLLDKQQKENEEIFSGTGIYVK